jgi:hypothetical protein
MNFKGGTDKAKIISVSRSAFYLFLITVTLTSSPSALLGEYDPFHGPILPLVQIVLFAVHVHLQPENKIRVFC